MHWCPALAYLQRSKVDYTIDLRILFEDLVQSTGLSDVEIVEGWALSADQLDAVDGFLRRVAEVVDDDDLIISF